MSGDDWEADDIAQETFIAAFRSADNFERRSSEATWLYGIALRIHSSRYRSVLRRVRRVAVWASGRSMEPVNDASTSAVLNERQSQIQLAVGQLPKHQREVVVLRFSEDMSIPQIAETLACPDGTVKSRLHAALQTLKDRLTPVAEEISDVIPVKTHSLDCREAST